MASSDGDHGGRRGGRGTQDDALDARLRDLGARLHRAAPEQPKEPPSRGSALGLAFRLATELVAGLVVGGLIGWFLDNWLGTSPLMLLVFFALGAAAGILNVVRTARQMQEQAVARHGWGDDLPDDPRDRS